MNGALPKAPPLLPALLLVTSVWLVLLVGQAGLGEALGRGVAVPLSFALATALVLAARAGPLRRPSRSALAWLGGGVVAGAASYPAWVGLVAGVGAALGLAPPQAARGPAPPLVAAAMVGLAPVFEEVLYRERLLASLRAHTGAAAAVLLSSAAFALPHLEPWALLGTFMVGLALGAAMCWTRSLALCIGLHAGLNLAAAGPAAGVT
jgi:membrane protease YdiL (CAAX protease family)